MSATEAIKAISELSRGELEAVQAALNTRSKYLRAQSALTNQAELTPGTRVVTVNLRPKYLSGLHGVVGEGESRRGGDIPVVIDEDMRWQASKYVSPHTGRVNVPAASLRREREDEARLPITD